VERDALLEADEDELEVPAAAARRPNKWFH
jgi:hypothetical protein